MSNLDAHMQELKFIIKELLDTDIGKRARKIGGSYQSDGTIVAIFQTVAGEWRVVFEFDQPKGLLHIFNSHQVKVIE